MVLDVHWCFIHFLILFFFSLGIQNMGWCPAHFERVFPHQLHVSGSRQEKECFYLDFYLYFFLSWFLIQLNWKWRLTISLSSSVYRWSYWIIVKLSQILNISSKIPYFWGLTDDFGYLAFSKQCVLFPSVSYRNLNPVLSGFWSGILMSSVPKTSLGYWPLVS